MLKIEHLSKNYGSFPALRDLSIEIPDGALHGFVGPNGAGKTTTMRILATLMRPTAGTAYVDGTDIIRDGQKARRSSEPTNRNERKGRTAEAILPSASASYTA